MLFGSLEFFLFIPVVYCLWLFAPSNLRWLVLLCASYYFYYSWNSIYPVILAFCTLASWWLAVLVGKEREVWKKRLFFIFSVVVNLGPLLYFKYFTFITDSLSSTLKVFGFNSNMSHFDILLPVGISFFTLQAISYSADVYQGKVKPEHHIGIFSLYLSFFPRLISGPIERGKNLLPQLQVLQAPSAELFWSGMRLFFWGLFMKLVLADRMGMYVDMVYSQPADYWGKTIIIAVLLYALQIYCDFSAYMNMAIGCGRIFGIKLSNNFNFPYMATSIVDFWRRWHITLTSWFRDYVYIPMGGNKVTPTRWALNIMVVFLISGLWHGAAWSFVIWGGLHGFFYLFGRFTAPARLKIQETLGLRGNPLVLLQIVTAFLLVTFAWIFFRAANVHDAGVIISHMFMNISAPPRMMASQFSTYLSWGAALVFVCLELFRYWGVAAESRFSGAIPVFIKYPAYVVILLATSLLGVSSTKFIYFHF
jgi:D-alanyl-lipoteichoic acid acyltransferase DltB (MBOAT superfamily)